MEGGVTRQRGYLWIALLLVLAAIVAVIWSAHDNTEHEATTIVSDTTLETWVNEKHNTKTKQRHQNRHQNYRNTSHRQTSNTYAPQQYAYRQRRTIVEINSADSIDLVQLYNIGPTIARRIIKYRTLLGGFVNKNQLREVYGIDSARYNDIEPYTTIDTTGITRLDINTTDIDQLKRHPYLDYYQAKAIVRLREKAGPYHDISEILNIPIIDTTTYNRIKPYIECSSQPSK